MTTTTTSTALQTGSIGDYFAGFVQASFNKDVRQEIEQCMVQPNDELKDIMSKAIKGLTSGDEQAWEKYMTLAHVAAMYDLSPCLNDPELNEIGRQATIWWTGFWSMPDAQMQVQSNYDANEAQIADLAAKLDQEWNAGQYFEAGQSFADFWSLMIGKPSWQEGVVEEEAPRSEHPIADFYGHGLQELWKEDWVKEINECLTQDELTIIAWDFALQNLHPYNEENWIKYFTAIGTLDMFNWAPCMNKKGLKELTEKNAKWWTDFWSQEDSKAIMEKNIKKNEEAVGIAVISLQTSWRYGDYANAGKAYGDFWGLLMGFPIEREEKKGPASAETEAVEQPF